SSGEAPTAPEESGPEPAADASSTRSAAARPVGPDSSSAATSTASGTGPGSRASILPPTWTVSRPPTPADQAASVVDGSTSETISALTSSARISGRPARRASAYVVSSAPPAPGLSPESENQNGRADEAIAWSRHS